MSILKAFFLSAAALNTVCLAEAAGVDRPNIVFLLADDLGYGDLSCYGAKTIATPNIDRLATEGIRFTQAYACPECSPSRAALLSGGYPQRVGGLECAIGIGNAGRYDDAIRLAARDQLGLPSERAILASALQKAGYATGIVGKWHLGYAEQFSPNRAGFDYAHYAMGGEMDYFFHVEKGLEDQPMLRKNGEAISSDRYYTDVVVDEAEGFIARTVAKPFFLYVSFTTPHAPYQGPGDRRSDPLPADSPLWSQTGAPPKVYAAMVEDLDRAVGRILEALKRAGIQDRTLVVFMSDNGGTRAALNCGLRGFKGSTFEGGIRVPAIAVWRNVLPAGRTENRPAIIMDFTCSILRAAGAAIPDQAPFDGIDILGNIRNGSPETERPLFWRARRGESTWKAVRAGSMKYVVRRVGSKTAEEGLFDLTLDPAENENLLATRPAEARRLTDLLTNWETAVKSDR